MPRVPMPQQTIRMDAAKWEKLGEVADPDRSTVIRQLVDWYLRERGAILPERPERAS